MRPIALVAAAAAVLALAAPLTAQAPGDELPPSMARARGEYLSRTYTDVKQMLVDWQDLHQKNDAVKLGKLFTDDGLFSPVEGWYVQGRAALVDSMRLRIPRIQGYHSSLIDFTASGGLAYFLGRMSYRRQDGAGVDVTGTFVMVLYLDGRHWKIRSYIERAGPID